MPEYELERDGTIRIYAGGRVEFLLPGDPGYTELLMEQFPEETETTCTARA